ncbi:RNA polymerase sigma factor (sigma-70 family) [Streptomyces canus]|uniref:RNA polymerase sigma factor (Sigma-70 family) n=1 Tax=Streptomyces canus TaxID=58343 RepID=A0AAW8FJF5_9ACTN|nr:sigma-70 family RNA polymerase sigma factor [Streptomyces canus]MDQ0910261.1 RNA polymerase sigma factor (sigma-70 family) [Streptomyces canus]
MTDQPARVPAQASPSATAAYVRIYEEEQPRLVAYARSLTRNTWAAEDLVAEAHFRVWRRLSAGHEIDNVPAYLMTTVRHLASSVASATHETPRDPQIPEQASSGHVEDPAEQVSSTDLLVRVLGELPERWVQALWLADAEGQPLETVGRQIGAKQGATAVLLHRAREGMRQAFLRSQTEAPDDPACEVHWVRMPAYVRGNATPRQSERLLAHVDACDGCRGRLAVLIRANNRLPALVGPALLVFVVGGGTGKFLASLTAGSAGAASVTGQGLLHTVRAAGPKTKAALASGTAAAAAVAVVLALGVNESPATVTSPGKAPVAQGPVVQAPVTQAPVTEPSAGAAGETPGGAARQVERDEDRGRTRGDGVGAVVTEDVGGTGNSGDSGSASGSSDGGGGEGDPGAPEQPAPKVPDPGPSPVEPAPEVPDPGPNPVKPAPEVPDPGPNPVKPAPGGEEPEPPAEPEPTPAPPKEQQPEPEQPKPGTPGEEPPVPEPSTPTPADPDPVGETPEPPTYSEPPTAPEPPEPSEPSEPPAPETPEPPTPGDDCGPAPTPEHTTAHSGSHQRPMGRAGPSRRQPGVTRSPRLQPGEESRTSAPVRSSASSTASS